MAVFDIIFITWIVIIVLTAVVTSIAGKKRNAGRRSVRVSSDGHKIPRNMDITCEGEYGHNHSIPADLAEKRYIVHEEPEEGYVILNGVKRNIRDCKYL